MINHWYLINQFNKRLIYDEDEQQLQIHDETLESHIIWEIKELKVKEIEEDPIPDVKLRLLQIEVKNESVKATLFKSVRTKTIT